MRLLHNSFKASVTDRKILAVMMVAFVLTNSHVTAVHAEGLDSVVLSEAASPLGTPDQQDTQDVEPLPLQGLPVAQPRPRPVALRTVQTTMTAYSSAPNQTDGTPFVTADGSCVNDGIVASNFLKIGTRVRFPGLFGEKIFEVHDRMNERYFNRIDVWMKDIRAARQFGVKRNVRVEIISEGDNKKQWELGLTDADCKAVVLAMK